MNETYKILFNYKRLDEKDPQQFFVTYHIGHTREFLEFISECIFEADDCSKYADNVNEFKPENIGKKNTGRSRRFNRQGSLFYQFLV